MEWQRLQAEQEQLYTQLQKVDKMTKQKRLIEGQIAHARQEMDKYVSEHTQIRLKLDKLEGFSFMNMIRTWTGQQDELRAEKVDKAAVLELKINEVHKMVEDLTSDFEQLSQKLTQINEQQLQDALSDLYVKKKNYLQLYVPEYGQKLEQLANEEVRTKQLIAEILEAEEAGDRALTELGQAAASLHTANGYSIWDTFFGGGMVATHLKYNALDEVESYLHNAQIALQRFYNELLDLQDMSTNALHVETDGFVKFADYFFDDIFSAWSVHSKISTAREQISRIQDDVHNTIRRLQEKHMRVVEELEALQNEKNAILQL